MRSLIAILVLCLSACAAPRAHRGPAASTVKAETVKTEAVQLQTAAPPSEPVISEPYQSVAVSPAPFPNLENDAVSGELAAPGTALVAEQILALPANYYAVQLAAFRRRDEVLAYIRAHDLGDPAYGRLRRGGEVWFVVLYGVWATKSEAQSAVAALPAHLRSPAPWVRRLGDLQQAIKAVAP